MAYVDKKHKEDLKKIINECYVQPCRAKWDDGSIAKTIKIFGLVNRYDLSREFPLGQLREINYKAAIDEILWIYQLKSNDVALLNSKIWDQWTDEKGTIGKAYGYQAGKIYDFPKGKMDQVDNILHLLKNDPNSRRMVTNLYNFADLKQMKLEPCAYSMTFNVTGDKLNGILNKEVKIVSCKQLECLSVCFITSSFCKTC